MSRLTLADLSEHHGVREWGRYAPVAIRLLRKLEEGTSGCWHFMGSRNDRGYGHLSLRSGRLEKAHRVAHELWIGDIPVGLEVDHLCFTPSCCNPAHLEAVPRAENLRRKYARITHCPHGHAYDVENTYVRPNGQRVCRACHRVRERLAYPVRMARLRDAA